MSHILRLMTHRGLRLKESFQRLKGKLFRLPLMRSGRHLKTTESRGCHQVLSCLVNSTLRSFGGYWVITQKAIGSLSCSSVTFILGWVGKISARLMLRSYTWLSFAGWLAISICSFLPLLCWEFLVLNGNGSNKLLEAEQHFMYFGVWLMDRLLFHQWSLKTLWFCMISRILHLLLFIWLLAPLHGL